MKLNQAVGIGRVKNVGNGLWVELATANSFIERTSDANLHLADIG